MSGIGGIIGIHDEGAVLGRRLLASLRHRGPDDEGLEQPLRSVTLVHARLAIVDLTQAGHQPMRDHPPAGLRPNWIVFNGEIYNFRTLQRDVAASKWRCRTNCDTEVILNAYRAWGERCVHALRGMFAFCLIDPIRGVAHFWRDRFGIKPLYLYRPPHGGLIFASELRTILSLGPEAGPRRVNAAAMESYFAQGAVQGYHSIIEGVSLLPPASHLMVNLETGAEISRRTYWELPPAEEAIPKRNAAVEQLRPLLRDTVKLHLASDAPAGIFLSGGVDSVALLAMASEAGCARLRTLTAAFDAGEDSAQAARIAQRFGADHAAVPIAGQSAAAMLDEGLAAMDQPTVDGFNTYFISRAARQSGLTVALSGIGGDEVFGGYASFVDVPRTIALRRLPLTRWIAGAAPLVLRSRFGVKANEVFRRAADTVSIYLLGREVFLPAERRALHPLPEGVDSASGIAEDLIGELATRISALDHLNSISFLELNLYMRHMLLRDADAFSMAAPIEYRVPLLDHIVVQSVFNLPGAWKQPDPRPKPLLLDIAGKPLPSSVWKHPRQGFAFPWERWFGAGGPLHERARVAIFDEQRWKALGIAPAAVIETWSRFGRHDRRISPLQVLAFISIHDYATRFGLYAA